MMFALPFFFAGRHVGGPDGPNGLFFYCELAGARSDEPSDQGSPWVPVSEPFDRRTLPQPGLYLGFCWSFDAVMVRRSSRSEDVLPSMSSFVRFVIFR